VEPGPDVAVLELPELLLDSGATLRDVRLVYQTWGTLDAARGNAVLLPTALAGRHGDNAWLFGPGRPLDPARHFIIVPDMLGNGLSSSPSNTRPPFDGPRFPLLGVRDNIAVQHALVVEHLGIERLRLVAGNSMGAGQAFQWSVSHAERVDALLAICGSARTSRHNGVFLEGVKAALQADTAWKGGWYDRQPTTGLRAAARVYAGWGFSQAFYRDEVWRELGFSSLEDFLVGFWEGFFLDDHDANDLLCMIGTWQRADVGATPGFDGDLVRALGSVRARTIVMPGEKDLYFPPEDSAYEASLIPGAELRVIPGRVGPLRGQRPQRDRHGLRRPGPPRSARESLIVGAGASPARAGGRETALPPA